MAKKGSFVNTPVDMIATPPKGNKGGPGVYNGDDQAPASEHRRTTSKDGVPEKLFDGSVPSTGGKKEILPDKLPKNI